MKLQEYKDKIRQEILNFNYQKYDLSYMFGTMSKKEFDEKDKKWKDENLKLLDNDLIKGTVFYGYKQVPVLVKLTEQNDKVCSEWVKSYHVKIINFNSQQYEIDENKLKGTDLKLVYNKWIDTLSNNKLKHWKDRKYDFHPFVLIWKENLD